MKKLFKFIGKLWNGIKQLFSSVDKLLQQHISTAVITVENLKQLADSPSLDVITAIIPGNVDDKIKEKLRDYLPVLLDQLRVYETCNKLDPDQKLQCIVRQINLSTNNIKNHLYHGLASLIIQTLSDGKLSFGDCIVLSEYYYNNFVKLKSNGI